MSRKEREVTQRIVYKILCVLSGLSAKSFFLCLAKSAKLRKDLIIGSFAFMAGFARNLFLKSRKEREVTLRILYKILCVLSGLSAKSFFLCLAKSAKLRKGLFIRSFAFSAGLARKVFFYVSQRTRSYAKTCLLDPLRSWRALREKFVFFEISSSFKHLQFASRKKPAARSPAAISH